MNVSAIDIISTRQRRPVIEARRLVVRIAVEERIATVAEIAEYFGACTASISMTARRPGAYAAEQQTARVREALKHAAANRVNPGVSIDEDYA